MNNANAMNKRSLDKMKVPLDIIWLKRKKQPQLLATVNDEQLKLLKLSMNKYRREL